MAKRKPKVGGGKGGKRKINRTESGGEGSGKEGEEGSGFQLQGKYIFITYSNVFGEGVGKDAVMDRILFVLGVFKWEYSMVMVSREFHQNGVPHFHALICLKKKVNRKLNGEFNIVARGEVYVASIKTSYADTARGIWTSYVMKGGEFIYVGQHPLYSTSKLARNKAILRTPPLDACIKTGQLAVTQFLKTVANIRAVLVQLFNSKVWINSKKIVYNYDICGYFFLDLINRLGMSTCFFFIKWDESKGRVEPFDRQSKYMFELGIIIVGRRYNHQFIDFIEMEGARVITDFVVCPE